MTIAHVYWPGRVQRPGLSVPTGGCRDAQPGATVGLHVQEGVQEIGDGAEQVRQQVAQETTVEQAGHGAEQVAEQVAGTRGSPRSTGPPG